MLQSNFQYIATFTFTFQDICIPQTMSTCLDMRSGKVENNFVVDFIVNLSRIILHENLDSN